VGFENRQPGGNAEKKYDYKIIEKILRTSQALWFQFIVFNHFIITTTNGGPGGC